MLLNLIVLKKSSDRKKKMKPMVLTVKLSLISSIETLFLGILGKRNTI